MEGFKAGNIGALYSVGSNAYYPFLEKNSTEK